MAKYSFATDEIGVSDEGIHLLRSGYNYETIPYAEISRVRICRGREVNNWFLLFTIGLVVLVAGIILTYLVAQVLYEGHGRRRYHLGFVAFLPFIGGFFVYNSLKTGVIIEIDYTIKTRRFPLSSLNKQGSLKAFQFYLHDRLKGKLQK